MKKNRSILINIFVFPLIYFLLSFTSSAQDVIWANKLLQYTDWFQFENNFSALVLGPPTIYPQTKNLEEPHDPYSEGYIVHYIDTKKRNTFTVGFPKPVNAKQVVIGGIFNIGSIESITVVLKDNKEKVIYKFNGEASKVKFKSFATFMPYATVYGVKIVLDHSRINGWNIIKGIGLSNNEKLYEIKPSVIPDTSHHHAKEMVGDSINSADCFEFSPKIAPDGKTLYFVKECENQTDQDIWYAKKDSTGKWSEAKNIGVPLNNKGHNFVASISADGQQLIIGNRYKEDGSDAGDGVSIATKDEDGNWSTPKPIDIPGYQNLNDHANFFMNTEDNVMLMAIQDKASLGDLDLYVSLYNKTSKSWSPPLNLGPTVNTAFSEDYPYLANDGVTLYFSSKGHIGYGGHDIYMTKRLDDSWTKWSTPLNLGAFVNSKADDKGFIIASHGDHAYFNSVSFGEDLHHMDIYKVDLPKMLHQNPRILVSGLCIDGKTKQPLRTVISVKDENDELIAYCASNPKTGKYIMSIPFGKVYNVSGDVIDHFKFNEKLSLTDQAAGIEVTKNIEFMPFLDTGTVYKMENIQFEYNKTTLLESSYDELNKIADLMKQQRKSSFMIEGHTDNVGSLAYNQKLSEERVKVVIKYLGSRGVNPYPYRLAGKGYGELKPIADNETEEGRALNRRVEFKVLEKDTQAKENEIKKKKMNSSRFKPSYLVNKKKK